MCIPHKIIPRIFLAVHTFQNLILFLLSHGSPQLKFKYPRYQVQEKRMVLPLKEMKELALTA